ncbi:MAG: hypothetical protein KGN84_19805 [Acidobacteriota bacterium]|nr:hypothetical protein [Acidobacteriota bacterium]
MRLRNSFLSLLLAVPCLGGTFAVLGTHAGSWPSVLSAAGHVPAPASSATILVAPIDTPPSSEWQARVNGGAVLILEGTSPLAASFGFRPSLDTVSVIHIVDEHNPAIPIVWSKAIEIPKTTMPAGARVFAKDRWSGQPMIAGLKVGEGAVLWVALSPGVSGYERFPYLPQALADLGAVPSFRSSRLWAFFDYSYRTRADPDYLAVRWRATGIGAIHVASWHFYDSDPGRDEYLKHLIEACHRQGVLVYAWVELPHVSERFWADHPEWREKTAVLQDAQLDWRKLMNLQNRVCADAVKAGLHAMLNRFDWDGVNLAELYFESLEGAGNPARFTPMNDDVRAAFRAQAGWDPIEIWRTHNDAKSLRQFLDFRADLARRMQEEWLGNVEGFGKDLDVVLTHVDDRFDSGMKDAIGADAARVLPLLDTHKFSFLIEDPATVWNLGPQRYPEIAKRYAPLTSHTDRLAIDINIVDRYQDVYPTKQQTGTELFELVHLASAAFPRVALYFENSILKPDLALLAASSAVVTKYSEANGHVTLDTPAGVDVAWRGDALVDSKPWPIQTGARVTIPAGVHTLDPAPKAAGLRVIDLNASLKSAGIADNEIQFEYESDSRALVRFNRTPSVVSIDGKPTSADCTMLLPRGFHRITAK